MTTKTASGIVGQLMTPVLWILVVGPALADSLGSFSPGVDYYTFIAVGQVAFLLPFTAMFSGINVIVDKDFGITRELLVAPVRRWAIPLANAAAVLTITFVQVAIIVGLGSARGASFHTSLGRLPWFLLAAALLCLTVYGLAETLALRIGRQEAYGPLIPAIGVSPGRHSENQPTETSDATDHPSRLGGHSIRHFRMHRVGCSMISVPHRLPILAYGAHATSLASPADAALPRYPLTLACARIRTSTTRSLVGSASSSLTTSSAGTVPSIRASNGNRSNASRSGNGPDEASVFSACGNERPAAIDARTSRSPSGQASWTSRSRAARRRAK